MEACISGPTMALLGVMATAVQAAIVTLFWLLVRSQNAQIAKAEAREDEWKRVAIRGANEIIPPLASAVRQHLAPRIDELREP